MKLIRLSLAVTALLVAACSGAPARPGTDGATPEATKAAATINPITPPVIAS